MDTEKLRELKILLGDVGYYLEKPHSFYDWEEEIQRRLRKAVRISMEIQHAREYPLEIYCEQ